jgi:nucleoside-diphosphate-sugar epimerase
MFNLLKTVLVTGYNGFIGSHLIPQLVKTYNVVGLSTSKTSTLKIPQIKADITKINYKTFPSKISKIIHLAAVSDVDYCQKNPTDTSKINIFGTQKILELARKNDSQVIFLSTAHVFGSPKNNPVDENYQKNPKSIYAATKLAGEALCESYSNSYGLNIGVIRLFSVYGPNSPKHAVIESITKQIITKKIVKLGNIKSKRDFLYIDDAINAILLIMEKNHDYNEYNVGNEKSYSINQICKILKNISKKEFTIITSKTKIRKNDSRELISNSSKLKKLGWKPKTSVPEGLRLTYSWYLNNFYPVLSHTH